jgi:GAF domain-containing protein
MLNFFRNLLNFPDFPNEDDARIARIFQNVLLSLWLFPVFVLGLAVAIPGLFATLIIPEFSLLALLITLSLMLRRGAVRLASIILVFGLILLSTYINYRSGGLFSSPLTAYVIIILIASLLLGLRGGLITFILLVAQETILGWAGARGLIQDQNSSTNSTLIDFLVLFIGYFVSLLIFQISASGLSQQLKISRSKEKELRTLSEELDTRVQERSSELDRRTTQLEAAALVTRAAAEVQDLRELLENMVVQITERFNFYHAGIFLTDVNAQFVVLEAASSEGGKKMIERGHRLEIGRQGIVGFAAYQRRPRVAQDTGEDAVFFNNPDLPETHSEIALPLIAQGRLTGVLDIQSLERNAFTNEDIHTLQTMADQIALAIENTRLIDESRSAINELQMLTAENTFQLWKERLSQKSTGYVYSSLGVLPLSDAKEVLQAPNTGNDEHVIKFPIALRGQQIGVLSLKRKSSEASWTEAEQEMASKIAAQVALAIENARLLEESQRRAEKESTISDITSKIRKTNDPNEMIRVAITELKHALNINDVRIIPYNPPKNGDGKKEE